MTLLRTLVVALVVAAAAFTGGAAAGYHGALAELGASSAGDAYDVVADAHELVVITGSAFEPRAIVIETGALVEIELRNEDSIWHTFTYARDGEILDHGLPAGSTVRVLTRFETPGEVAFWCKPHSGGHEDGTPSGMAGTLRIEGGA